MQVTSVPLTRPQAAARPSASASSKAAEDRSLKDFYQQYQTPIHIAGGALLGAGIAKLAGVPSEAILGAAGAGALAGFVAGDFRNAVCMAGGAIVGASIAALAGAPGPAIVGAAGTGTLIGWIVG
ncbi:MAG: hypothetical protein AB1758_29820 [Candidatus Eremiobacterota bacterium]